MLNTSILRLDVVKGREVASLIMLPTFRDAFYRESILIVDLSIRGDTEHPVTVDHQESSSLLESFAFP